ncbi:hypothetical protein AAC387_Pa08g1509 [Persea americana]
MARLDVKTGAIQWQTFMLPDKEGQIGGYSGAAVWGSSPSIVVDCGLVYIGTGNLYTAPPDVIECEEIQSNKTVRDYPDPCVEPENHENSIIALDMDTWEMRWYKQLGGFDAWILACSVTGTPNCPSVPNPDADFGEAPMLLTIVANGTTRYVVAAVQKNGFAWALDHDHGDIVWSAVAGPRGSFGRGTWGASTDGIRVYTNIVNSNWLNFTLTPSGQVTNAGAWVAMDAGSCGPRLILKMHSTMAQSPQPMVFSLLGPLMRVAQSMPWMQRLGLYYGPMTLVPLFMVACLLVMVVSMSEVVMR